jgi:hypothetical protein
LIVQLLIDKFLGTALTEGPERTDVSDKEETEEESVYEQPTDKAVIHSVNCQELIGCICTPKSDSDRFSEERAAAIKRLHAGRNERARQRQRQRKAGADSAVASGTAAAHTDDWDSLGDLGPI